MADSGVSPRVQVGSQLKNYLIVFIGLSDLYFASTPTIGRKEKKNGLTKILNPQIFFWLRH